MSVKVGHNSCFDTNPPQCLRNTSIIWITEMPSLANISHFISLANISIPKEGQTPFWLHTVSHLFSCIVLIQYLKVLWIWAASRWTRYVLPKGPSIIHIPRKTQMYLDWNFSCSPSSSMSFIIWRAASLPGTTLCSNTSTKHAFIARAMKAWSIQSI